MIWFLMGFVVHVFAHQIYYSGPEEYNLEYHYQGSSSDGYVILDDDHRPNWEFEVNNTFEGGTTERGWQWNHIALVHQGKDPGSKLVPVLEEEEKNTF